MINEKRYRKSIGFTNTQKFKNYLSAKDIVEPNLVLINKRNERLVDIFQKVHSVMRHKEDINIRDLIYNTTNTIIKNDLLRNMRNHGRAIEDVYYSWLSGYVVEVMFNKFIMNELNLTELTRFGKDDFNDPLMFNRTHDADLVSHKQKIFVDVQSGFTGMKYDVKKGKVEKALKHVEYDTYIFFVDIMNGNYATLNLKSIQNESFVPNPQWEGQLCYTVPYQIFNTFCYEPAKLLFL